MISLKTAGFVSSLAFAALATLLPIGKVDAQGGGKGAPKAAAPKMAPLPPGNAANFHILKVQGNIYMLVGPTGTNSAVSIGDSGVLVVDTQPAAATADLVAAIRTLSDKPIRYIFNTTIDPDHIGGNEQVARIGAPVLGGNLGGSNTGAAIYATENALKRMSGMNGGTEAPAGARPTTTFFEGQKELFFNHEGIEMILASRAHSDADSIVYFRRSDVIAAGDVFLTTTYPVINTTAGGNVQGVLAALNHILDIAIPEHNQEGGTYIIPGHGRLCDEHDVLEYRDMVTIVRDRVQTMTEKGMTLAQVQAAKPTFEYDRRYGSGTMFVEAVYKSLEKK